MFFLCAIPWIMRFNIKKRRFGKVGAAMLKYLRCPHGGYDLRLLPTDPVDGATVCPECGLAWKLYGQPDLHDQGTGVSGTSSLDCRQNGEGL